MIFVLEEDNDPEGPADREDEVEEGQGVGKSDWGWGY